MRKLFITVRPAIALTLAALGACSSSHSAAGPCAGRAGTYRINYTERSGNCGQRAEAVVVLDAQAMMMQSACTGEVTHTDDNCSTTEDVTCPTATPGQQLTQRGTFHWAEDASGGGGIVQIVVTDNGAPSCTSSYDVTFTRL